MYCGGLLKIIIFFFISKIRSLPAAPIRFHISRIDFSGETSGRSIIVCYSMVGLQAVESQKESTP